MGANVKARHNTFIHLYAATVIHTTKWMAASATAKVKSSPNHIISQDVWTMQVLGKLYFAWQTMNCRLFAFFNWWEPKNCVFDIMYALAHSLTFARITLAHLYVPFRHTVSTDSSSYEHVWDVAVLSVHIVHMMCSVVCVCGCVVLSPSPMTHFHVVFSYNTHSLSGFSALSMCANATRHN